MNRYDNLLKSCSDELSVARGVNENENEWKARIVYSVIALLSSASIFDITEREIIKGSEDGESQVSVVHFKKRVKELLDAFLIMYPELNELFACTPDVWAEDLYKMFEKTGVFYHCSNRTLPCEEIIAEVGEVCFVRGEMPSSYRELKRSGAGGYKKVFSNFKANLKNEDDKYSKVSLCSMFGIPDVPLVEDFNFLIRHITENKLWFNASLAMKLKYLDVKSSNGNAEFIEKRQYVNDVNLAYSEESGQKIYYLCRLSGADHQIAQLPNWRVAKREFLRISFALLMKSKRLLPTRYCQLGNVVRLELRSVYPPAEQNLIRLYSWPVRYQASKRGELDPLNRVMATPVFNAIRTEFERLGYVFENRACVK